MEMTGGQALARQLAREGADRIFGVPGVQLDWAMDGIAQTDQLTFVNTRHEQAASYMADGFARGTGGIGVCMVVPGPGLLNAAAGLATAYACSSPVLCVAGQIPSRTIGGGLGMLHEIPGQSQVLAGLTKWTGLASTPGEIPGLVGAAMRELRSGRPRPVGLEIPPDVLSARADVDLLAPSGEAAPVRPDPDLLRKAAELLRAAERPVIYAGWGVQAAGAEDELRVLAETLGAPVVMSPNGRGALSDRHPLALTSLGGREVLPSADAVLVVGSRFVNTMGRPVLDSDEARFVLLNAEEADLGGPRRADVAVHGDARLGLAGLREHLDGAVPRRPDLAAVRDSCARQVAEIEPQATWVRALRAGIPDDGILVNELTQVGYVAQVAYPVYGSRTYLTPGYQGTLGYGFATALGVKVGSPDRTVVSINGDGGFGWNLQELSTARKHGIGLIAVVFNDGAFGNVRRTQKERFEGRYIATDLANPDFVRLAESFGVRAARATTPEALTRTVQEAQGTTEPILIEVPVEPMPNPWHLILDFAKR